MSPTEPQPEPTPTPNPAGGPNTLEGRAISSRNATTFGLYATRDFVRPGEESDYRDLGESLRQELAPIGILENNLVDEIRRAMWRLGRCGEVEQFFVADHAGAESIPDPMRHETQARLQFSVDRARALYQRLLHKCTAELRKLQTERHLRNESFPAGTDVSHFGLCDWSSISKDLARQFMADYTRNKLQGMAEIDAILSIRPPAPPAPGSFCKTPRNAQCPCGSGQKHKRCCGKNAPPMQRAA
jgi:hypothetical protein